VNKTNKINYKSSFAIRFICKVIYKKIFQRAKKNAFRYERHFSIIFNLIKKPIDQPVDHPGAPAPFQLPAVADFSYCSDASTLTPLVAGATTVLVPLVLVVTSQS
jgi:hypothetical protein